MTKTKNKVTFTVTAGKWMDQGMVFRAFRGSLPVGSVYVRVTRTGYGYVHDMYVRSDQRRHGAGHAMMKAVIAEYGATCRLELICGGRDGITNEQLAAFYGQYGFAYGPSAWATRESRDSDSRRMFRAAGP